MCNRDSVFVFVKITPVHVLISGIAGSNGIQTVNFWYILLTLALEEGLSFFRVKIIYISGI